MFHFKPAWLAAGLLLMAAGPALGQAKAADASVYLRCDGNPAHRSIGESLGRALVLSATLGLAGKGETQDVSKRAYGVDGADACLLAL